MASTYAPNWPESKQKAASTVSTAISASQTTNHRSKHISPHSYLLADDTSTEPATTSTSAAEILLKTAFTEGVWHPESAVLRKLRKAIVDNSEEFHEIIDNPELKRLFPGWYGERLKTIPKGYDKTTLRQNCSN